MGIMSPEAGGVVLKKARQEAEGTVGDFVNSPGEKRLGQEQERGTALSPSRAGPSPFRNLWVGDHRGSGSAGQARHCAGALASRNSCVVTCPRGILVKSVLRAHISHSLCLLKGKAMS